MKKFVYFIPVILWMCFIFYMSQQTGSDSSSMSNSVLEIVIRFIPIPEDILTMLIRKSAHMFEYFVLFILLFIAYYKSQSKYRYLTSYIITVLYACSDEIHQLFIPGRQAAIFDVMIDSFGALIGLLFVYLLLKCIAKRSN